MTLNETHRADLRSWVESAHDVGTDFPVQNLPLGVFRPRGADEAWRVGTSIGDQVVDLAAAARGLLSRRPRVRARDAQPGRSTLMELEPCTGRPAGAVSRLLRVRPRAAGRRLASRSTAGTTWNSACLWPSATTPISAAAPAHRVGHVPARQSLLPNYKWMPIGYHGRASSTVPAGIDPPWGQASAKQQDHRSSGRQRGWTMGGRLQSAAGVRRGRSVAHAGAAEILCLLNDWSAGMCRRGSTSLGVHGQSFAATLSPWVVTMDALAPRVQTAARGQAIRAAAYLTDRANAGAAVSPCWSGVYLGRRA